MKTLLLHAPGDSPCDSPWMGVPALVAHLKKLGFEHTHQRDLDLDLYHHSLDPRTHARICEIIKEGGKQPAAHASAKVRFFVRWFAAPATRLLTRWTLRDRKFFTAFREATSIEQQFPEKGVVRYRKTLQRVLKLMGIFYYPYLSYPKFFTKFEERNFYAVHLRLGYALRQTMELGRKALEDFYEQTVLPQVQKEDYDVIGISVSVSRQLEPALVLADFLRGHGIRAKLVLGGSYVSDTFDAGWLEDSVLEKVDYVIRYEGEEALPQLIEALRDEASTAEIPNLLYMENGERITNDRTFLKNMDALNAPDYDDLALEMYLDRPLRLPIMSNRGCYWGRCSFCSHHFTLGTGRMRARSPELVLEDMLNLQNRYGARSFFLTDESMHPEDIVVLSDLILEREAKVNWSGMMRFEDCMDVPYLEKVKAAGCYSIMFGLESIAQNIQDIIQKGVNTELVWRVLEDCKKVGIKVHLFIILGTPGETEEDMKENIDFLLKNEHLYETVQIASFLLTANSPMHKKPQKFGISNVTTLSGHASMAYSENAFDVDRGLQQDDIQPYFDKLVSNPLILRKDLWGGHGFRIYQPDQPDTAWSYPTEVQAALSAAGLTDGDGHVCKAGDGTLNETPLTGLRGSDPVEEINRLPDARPKNEKSPNVA